MSYSSTSPDDEPREPGWRGFVRDWTEAVQEFRSEVKAEVQVVQQQLGFPPAASETDKLRRALAMQLKLEETTWPFSLWVQWWAMLAAGPLSVVIVFVTMLGNQWTRLLGGVFTPPVEELAKVFMLLCLLESRAYWFKQAWQLRVAAAGAGLAFAAIENLLYLNVYIPDPSPYIIYYRWTVCTLLHMVCCCISSFGLVRMWRTAVEDLEEPSFWQAVPYLAVAAVIHGIYNFSVSLRSDG